jgi:hemoglobin
MTVPYDAIGEDGVRRVLQTLYDHLFEDKVVGFLFQDKDKKRLVEQQVAFTCGFLGGPQVYAGKPLPEAHANLPILAGHFDRRHRLLEQALDEHGVAADVREAWLRIDSALRPSVLSAAEEARARTHEPG